MKKVSWKMILIVAGIIAAVVLCGVAIGIHAENRCYSMEEQISESKSGIDIQLKNRNDSIKQLVQVVEQFSTQESKIVDSVTEARAQLNNGDATGALKTLNIVVENYPDIVDSCISCESWRYDGRTTVCGTCEPCKHTKMALMNLIVTESGAVRDKAIAMLRDNYGIEFEIHDHNGDKFEGFATRVEKVEDKEEVESDESNNIER